MYEGSCLCRSIRFEIDGELAFTYFVDADALRARL